MNILMVGDIVGPGAVDYLAGRLPRLRRDLYLDLVIANAENCAVTAPVPRGGFGMTVELVERLLGCGVDVAPRATTAGMAPTRTPCTGTRGCSGRTPFRKVRRAKGSRPWSLGASGCR